MEGRSNIFIYHVKVPADNIAYEVLMVKEGERYITKQDIKVICMTAWRTAYTGGHDAILPKGVEFNISNNPLIGATAVYCELVDYERWEKNFVPEEERNHKNYSKYYLCIDLQVIESQCEKVNYES